MLLKVSAAPMVKDHAARWWSETNAQARDALTSGDPRLALELVEHAGLTSGDQYAESGAAADRALELTERALRLIESR